MTGADSLTKEQWAFWSSWTSAQRSIARRIEDRLQSACGISKPDFSVMMTLFRSAGHRASMSDLVKALEWEKSRLSHHLSRMEKRGIVKAIDRSGIRRTAMMLTDAGEQLIEEAIRVHGESVRVYFLDMLSPDQAMAIRRWCDDITAVDEEPSFGRRSKPTNACE